MTRSSESNMKSVAAEVNKMELDSSWMSNMKVLRPNDQLRGKKEHIFS